MPIAAMKLHVIPNLPETGVRGKAVFLEAMFLIWAAVPALIVLHDWGHQIMQLLSDRRFHNIEQMAQNILVSSPAEV